MTPISQKKIYNAQLEVAKSNKVFFCDVANNVGWSQMKVTTDGYWDNGIWVPKGGSSQTITRLNQSFPDSLHPHTDKSGEAIKREAEIIAAYIKSNIIL